MHGSTSNARAKLAWSKNRFWRCGGINRVRPIRALEFRPVRVQASEIIESSFEKGHNISALPAPPGPNAPPRTVIT